jgi:hypothetical protein
MVVLNRIRLGQLTMRDATMGGAVQVRDGALTEVARFFNYFEVPFSTPIQLVSGESIRTGVLVNGRARSLYRSPEIPISTN